MLTFLNSCMVLTLEDFRKQGAPEHLALIERILSLSDEEHRLTRSINAIVEEWQRTVDRTTTFYGLEFSQLTVLIAEQEIYPDIKRRTASDRQKLAEVKRQMGSLFQAAAQYPCMHDLGFVQRNYEHYADRPLPTLSVQ